MTHAEYRKHFLGTGSALMALTYSLGKISGGHFNPAVSTAVLIRSDMTAKEYAFYILAQLCGSNIGCLLAWWFFGGWDLALIKTGFGPDGEHAKGANLLALGHW